MILIPNFHSRPWDHNCHYVYKCISQIEASTTSMTEGRQKRLQLSNKIFTNTANNSHSLYNKNWETLLAYLLRTKLLCNATEITATRSLNAQLFFVCHATYKAFYKKIHLLRLLPVHSIPRAYMRYSWPFHWHSSSLTWNRGYGSNSPPLTHGDQISPLPGRLW